MTTKFSKLLLPIALILGFGATVQAQNTATVAGSVKDIFNATDSSQQICFTLRDTRNDNSGSYQTPVNPRINGGGVLSNYSGNCVNATGGSYSITPFANDKISTQNGNATVWAITLKSKHGGETTLGTYRFLAGNTYDLSSATPVSVVPAVAAPTGDNTYLRLDGGNIASLVTTLAIPHNITVAGTLAVAGATTLANTTVGSANTLFVNNIKQQAGAAFVLADPLGPSHIFISSSSPYTNTFINGNGAGVVFLGSAAKTSVADTTGNIVTAGNITLQTTSQTLPAVISNDTAGGVAISNNSGKAFQFDNSTNVLFPGSTSGNTIVKAPAVASGTLTLPAATGTLVCDSCAQTLTNKIATTLGITGGTTNANLRFNSSAQIVNGNTTDDGTNFSTGTVKLQAQNGVTQGSGMKHQRFGSLCTTAASAGATCISTLTWTSAFADANYTVVCTGHTQSNTAVTPSIESVTASNFIIRIMAATASAATFATVDCIAMHD